MNQRAQAQKINLKGGGVIQPQNAQKIQVHPRQANNPVLKFIRNVQWEYNPNNIVDFATGSTCIIYVELKYHRMNHNYTLTRIHEVGTKYRLRVLLIYINDNDHSASALQGVLQDLNKTCFQNSFTLILATSLQER